MYQGSIHYNSFMEVITSDNNNHLLNIKPSTNNTCVTIDNNIIIKHKVDLLNVTLQQI